MLHRRHLVAAFIAAASTALAWVVSASTALAWVVSASGMAVESDMAVPHWRIVVDGTATIAPDWVLQPARRLARQRPTMAPVATMATVTTMATVATVPTRA